eukprot:m.11495 g.11495  ORF g.11495 m.11495 type:complete len:204 (+) comp9824_c0_seq1:89-700(+)
MYFLLFQAKAIWDQVFQQPIIQTETEPLLQAVVTTTPMLNANVKLAASNDQPAETERDECDKELEEIHNHFNNSVDSAFEEMQLSSGASSTCPSTPPASPITSRRSTASRSSSRRRRRQMPEVPRPKAKDAIHNHAMQVLDTLGLEHDIMVYLEPGKYHLNGDKSKNIVLQHRGKNLMVAGGGGYVPFSTYLQTRHHPLVSTV